jgi:PAS domain S-box-containing protein
LSAASLERLSRAMLGTPADAIIYADREGTIRFWNRGAERLVGFTAAEALGRSLDIMTPEPQCVRHWAGFRSAMETGESRYDHDDILAVPGLCKDGSHISLEFTILPMRAENGRTEGIW